MGDRGGESQQEEGIGNGEADGEELAKIGREEEGRRRRRGQKEREREKEERRGEEKKGGDEKKMPGGRRAEGGDASSPLPPQNSKHGEERIDLKK